MASEIYNLYKFTQDKEQKNIDTLIISHQKDTRSLYSIEKLLEKGVPIKNIVILNYNRVIEKKMLIKKLNLDESMINLLIVDIPTEQGEFIIELKKLKKLFNKDNLALDISCMNIPHMFLFLKYLKNNFNSISLQIFYTIPSDYIFSENPFISYKSYHGDLKTAEVLGYSGNSVKTKNANLIVFLGFEGALSLKVIEDIKYKDLTLANALPAYFQKYKDITVINNYETINQAKNVLEYVPSSNPFEVYNYLSEKDKLSEGLCIAPLSTKPIALGVCLYALQNPEVRVVYPASKGALTEITTDIFETIVFEVNL